MKIKVTAKHEEEERPLRGFIETKDIKLLLFTNAKKVITKIELTLGKKKFEYKDQHPFVLWSEAEQAIEFYLDGQRPKEKEVVTKQFVATKRKL